jgi:hypothetical protein
MPRRSVETYVLAALAREWEAQAALLPDDKASTDAIRKTVRFCATNLRRTIRDWHDEEESEQEDDY